MKTATKFDLRNTPGDTQTSMDVRHDSGGWHFLWSAAEVESGDAAGNDAANRPDENTDHEDEDADENTDHEDEQEPTP